MDVTVEAFDADIAGSPPDRLVVLDAGGTLEGDKALAAVVDCAGIVSMGVRASVGKDEVGRAMRYLAHLGKSVSVSSFSGGSAAGHFDLGADRFLPVSLCVTPREASRHNCQTRPDAAAKLLKSALSGVKAQAPSGDGESGEGDGREAKRARATPSVTLVALLPSSADHDPESQCASVAAAIARAAPLYSRKSGSRAHADVKVHFVVGGERFGAAPVVERLQALLDGVRGAASLVDTPTNELTTTEFARRAEAAAAEVDGVTFEMLTGEELKAAGLGGLYGVGKAATEPPRLVVLRYKGAHAGPVSVCMVGKGIVYDTGGLSIKTKTGMPGMKRDMGGAAAVMEAFFAAARTAAPVDLTAILCLAENAVGPEATRPDDVHTFFSGKTVEINNTDAEGRLVLGDGVAYAVAKYNPTVVCDICTLTGAQGVATGKHFAAVMASNEELERRVVLAGRACGDMCHPVPYAPELFTNEFKSEIADMKNSVASRNNAQVSCAGQFIGNHIDWETFKGSWLHIDMASPASVGERATGYGVALLLQTFVYPSHAAKL